MTETPPAWLLERHGTLERALLAADLAVVDAEAEVGARTRDTRAAMKRKEDADAEFLRCSRESYAAHDRLQNVRKHRDWVERLAAVEQTP